MPYEENNLVPAVELPKPAEPKVAAVLAYLAEHQAHAVSRDELIQTIWGVNGSDEALTQAVSKARKHLKDHGLDHGLKTIPREGYRLDLALERVENSGGISKPEPAEKGAVVDSQQSLRVGLLEQQVKHLERASIIKNRLLIACTVIIILLLAYVFYQISNRQKIIRTFEKPAATEIEKPQAMTERP